MFLVLIHFSQADDVAKAHPRIVEAVETMVRKGKWTVPGMIVRFSRPMSCLIYLCIIGYKEKFGDLNVV